MQFSCNTRWTSSKGRRQITLDRTDRRILLLFSLILNLRFWRFAWPRQFFTVHKQNESYISPCVLCTALKLLSQEKSNLKHGPVQTWYIRLPLGCYRKMLINLTKHFWLTMFITKYWWAWLQACSNMFFWYRTFIQTWVENMLCW